MAPFSSLADPDQAAPITDRIAGATEAQIETAYRERYREFLRVAVAITGHPESADDAVHDAFAEALRTRGGYRGGPGGVEAWLWRAVVNRARNQRRWARLRRQRTEPMGDGRAAPDAVTGDPAVRALVAALPERQRLVLFLRYYADLDYDGIAAALGIRRGTVGATLSAAHASLRRSMEVEA